MDEFTVEVIPALIVTIIFGISVIALGIGCIRGWYDYIKRWKKQS